ncbi:MAG: hypothetical protein FWC89_13825 [Defluviitaleaceae bacterium]|nr:hypothetical protein [Defluviitaleaceae bacterium]
MRNIKAIFLKQCTSMVKTPVLIAQGIVFLLMALAFLLIFNEDEPHDCTYCIPAYVCATCEEEEANRFQLPVPSIGGLFTVMFIGLASVGAAAMIVNEDKSTKNLRFMAMADVTPFQYMPATVAAMMAGISVLLVFYGFINDLSGVNILWFMAIGLLSALVSVLLGITIGLSRFPVLAAPICMLLGLGPTFGTINENLANAIRFTYVQQASIALADLDANLSSSFLIIAANGAVVLLAFIFMHRKNKFNV